MISFGKIPLLILPALVGWHSAALRAEDENLTTGTAPPPLVMEPAQATAPGLMRWLGDPLSRTANVSEWFWTHDGSHLYLQAEYGTRRQVWRSESGGSDLKLIGFLPLYPKMAASWDGRWIVGQGKFNNDVRRGPWSLGLFHADTLQGVWEIQSLKEFLNIDQMMFSVDGKYLIIGESINDGYTLSIIEVETGHRVKRIERTWPEDASGGGPFFPPGNRGPNDRPRPRRPRVAPGRVCFYVQGDSLLLSSVFDDQSRLTRVSLKTLESTPIGTPVEEEWRYGGFLTTPNGEWVAFGNDSDYSVRRWNGENYVEFFNGKVSDKSSENATFNSHDTCIYFSPDSAYFIITAAGRYKVIWLQNRQVVHESATESLKGFYAPDGRTFWQTAPQFRALDTATWEPRPEAAPWASHDVQALHFNPKGHQVLFGNEYAAEVWDVQGTQPLAQLAPPKSPILASFLWNASGHEVYGSDLGQFLRWKMPETFQPGKTERIVGETLYELPVRYQNTKREWFDENGLRRTSKPVVIAVDEATDTCLTAMHPFIDIADFRYPDRPLVMHHMDFGDQNPGPLENAFFGRGGKELYYSSDAAWVTSPDGNGWRRGQEMKLFAYDMETDHLRHSSVKSRWDGLVGYDKVRGRLIALGGGDGITVIDASTANPLKKLTLRSRAQWTLPAAVSPNGRWLVCMLQDFVTGAQVHKIALVDLDKGSLAALVPEPLSQVRSADFSADNAYLALGHQNGCVSLWNMTTMPQESAIPGDFRLVDRMTMGPRGQMSETGPAVHIPPKMGVVQPIPLKQGGTWLIDAKGDLNVDQFDVKIGDWVANGFPMHAHGQKVSTFNGPEAVYVDVSTELRDGSGNLRLQRHAHVDTRGQISFVDEWENLSDAPQDPRVDFVSALGVELTAMLCENGTPPEIKARKLVFGGGENHLAALLPPSADQPEQALGICFGGASAPQHPLLRWGGRDRSLVSEWTLHLAPFQRRVICHEVLQHPGQDPQSMPALFTEYRAHGFETHVPESLVDHVVNFAVEPQYRNAFEKLNRSKGLETDGSRKDVLGFHWRHTESIDDAESELGVERILPLWLNRQPLTFSRPSNDAAKNGEPETDKIEEFSSPDTPLQVQRRTFFSPEEGCLVTHDTFVNNTDKPVAMPADYLIVARTQIDSVIGADGIKLDLTEPFPVNKCQGRLAVIFQGDSKPALVLAVGDPQAALLPVLLYFPDTALFLHYDIKLAPGERVSLANLAAPRSLSALDKPVDAFAGLKSPMAFPRFQMKGIAAPANWQAGGK